MNDSEKELLIRIDERTEDIKKALERDYKCLHGNGQKGLIEKVKDLEASTDNLKEKVESYEKIPARVQTLENYHNNENGFLRKYGSVIAWVATTALALYSAIKHH